MQMPWKIRRALWWAHDRFYDNILVSFGYPRRINGPRVTSRHADEVVLMSPSELSMTMTERNRRRTAAMRWEAVLGQAGVDVETGLPPGYALLDGRTIPKSAYPELWSAIKAGAGYADPWLDLGGIEFDFTVTPTTHVLTVTQMVKLLETMKELNGADIDIDQIKRNLAPAALTQFDL
jgi:hypothetical protein